MTEHLVVSTVVLAIALAAARFLPLSARTRYALLLAGVAKFAIPTAVFRFVPVEVVPSPLRVFAAANAVTPPVQSGIAWLPLVWAAMAMLLFARWALLRTRTIAAALRSSTPASQREVEAVREARLAMNVKYAIDVVRSPVCEAPAVLRIVRPVIALPSTGCEHLGDDELRSLVLHECAHVARHDNLAALAQAIATSLLWFHPLVWLASRAITTTREQACDEKVADAMRGTDAYLAALTKICRAIAAPRTAGASCMAGANLKERITHLMSYDTSARRLWRHRIALAASVLLIAMSTVAIAGNSGKNEPYTLRFRVSPNLQFDFTITEKATGRLVSQPQVIAAPNEDAVVQTTDAEITFRITVNGTKESGIVRFEVKDHGTVVQNTTMAYEAKPSEYNGEPISINLRGADIKDVMETYAQLTGLDVAVDPELAGTLITFQCQGMPWDQSLYEIAAKHGLVITLEGKTIRVAKK